MIVAVSWNFSERINNGTRCKNSQWVASINRKQVQWLYREEKWQKQLMVVISYSFKAKNECHP